MSNGEGGVEGQVGSRGAAIRRCLGVDSDKRVTFPLQYEPGCCCGTSPAGLPSLTPTASPLDTDMGKRDEDMRGGRLGHSSRCPM